MRSVLNWTLVACAAMGLAGCGGGGGGGGSTPPPTGGGGGGGAPTDPLGAVGTLEEEQDRLFESLGLGVISPGYTRMAASAESLKTTAAGYCADPANGNLTTFQDAWRAAMIDWQSITIVRFGPVEENNRRLRIQFFPDPNDAVVNNVTSLLNNGQPIDEARVAGSAVGTQGLPAVEYLLFELGGLDGSTAGLRRCELLVAITENYDTIADELALAWDGAGQLLADFTSASGTFMDRAEVLTFILESLAQETEFVADEKVTRPQQTGAMTTESFRSEHSVENLIANTAAIRAFLDRGTADTDYGFRDYLSRAHDGDAISLQLSNQLQQAETTLAGYTATLEAVLMGTETEDVDSVRTGLQDLADSFIDAAVAADVNLGFNNQDGD